MDELGPWLERAYAACDRARALRRDPVRFVRRYADPADQEIAAVLASQLAYGRVDLFGPVLDALFDALDARGGPARAVARFEPGDAADIAALRYRWTRGADLVSMLAALRIALSRWGRLERVFRADTGREALQLGVERLRAAALEACGADRLSALSRGVRHQLAAPGGSSPCKRWNLFLRWMVRPPTEGIDLGIWDRPRPARLVIPLDTHVFRIARFIGLTRRATATWSAAEEITARLAAVDPNDPVRFDFALSHLGISGGCRGHRHDAVCPRCPLDRVCEAPDPIPPRHAR